MNTVKQRLSQLKNRNYVRKADPEENYWFDFSSRQVDKRRQTTGDEFYLILYGSPSVETDFFVIPYEALKHVLTEDNLVEPQEGDNRKRWIGNIRNNKLKITHSNTEVDLTPYKGNLGLLELAVDGFRGAVDLASEEGDLPDQTNDEEAPYTPENGDWRAVVVRQIKARRGQQRFRNDLRNRYGDRCLISGCRLLDIVEAAHIKPYRGKPDNTRRTACCFGLICTLSLTWT
jgi:hypothetical protein